MAEFKKPNKDDELELARLLVDSVNTPDGIAGNLEDFSEEQINDFKQAQECLELLRQTMASGLETPVDQPVQPAFDAGSLKRIGRFRIVREVGRGGFGIVLLARDEAMQRDVALKIPKAETVLSDESRKRFEREARAAGVLAHPAIVPIYECGQLGPVSYIAFAYCEGTSLDRWMSNQSQKLEPRLVAKMVARLADAVSHAHRRGVIHRDLKPSNILIADGDDAASEEDLIASLQITDFGLAKIEDDQEDLTLDGALIGTPTYMPPEQAIGKNENQPTIDVYSLGVMLFQLLTGEVPFKGKTNLAVLKAVTEQVAPSPRKINKDIPHELAAICLKCLEKEPSQRYATAMGLCEDLNRFLDNRPVVARPKSWLQHLQLWGKRNPVVAQLSFLLVASLIAGTLTTWNLYRKSETNLQLAQSNLILADSNYKTAKETVESLFEKAMSAELQAQPKIRSEMLITVSAYYTRFVEQQQDSDLDYELAQAHRNLSKIDADMGDHKKALAQLNKAQAILDRCVDAAAPVEHRLEVLSNMTDIGLAFDELSQLDESLAQYQLAETFGEELLNQHPDNAQVELACSRTLKNIGYVYYEMKQFEEAKDYYDRALLIRQGLLDREPENPEYLFRVAFSHSTMVHWHIDQKLHAEALSNAESYMQAMQKLVELHPDKLDYRRHLAESMNRVSDVYRRFPDRFENWSEVAIDHLTQAEELQRELLAEFPLFMKISRNLRGTLSNLGIVYQRTGQIELAIEKLQEGIELTHQIMANNDAPILTHREWLGHRHFSLANAQRLAEQDDAARENYEIAEGHFHFLLQEHALHESNRQLTWTNRRGLLRFRLNRFADSIEDLQDVVAGGSENWEIATFIASAHLAVGDLPAALDACELATTFNRGKPNYANFVRAVVFAQQGKTKQARKELEKGRKYLATGKLDRLIILKDELDQLANAAETALQ